MTADASQSNCIEFQNQISELIESGADLSNHPHVQSCERCKAFLRDIHRRERQTFSLWDKGMMDRHEGRRPRPNDMVILREMPAGLLDDLPTEDQRAIVEIIGKPVRLNNYDGDGRAELEFTDRYGKIHFIFVRPDILSPAYTIQVIKDWRKTEYKAGRPSELADFYRAHGIDICVDCGGQGTRVIGVRWRDDEGMERSEVGPVASLVQRHALDERKCWLTDARKWDYLYAPCLSCEGSGKLSKPSKSDHAVE